MNDLINVSISNIGCDEVNSVNLRDVHAFVGSKQQFGNWATNRLGEFTEAVDYIANKIINNNTKQLVSVDYIVTLDTAKHICMIERNDKGKKLRQYFIDVEKRQTSLLKTAQIDMIKQMQIEILNNQVTLEAFHKNYQKFLRTKKREKIASLPDLELKSRVIKKIEKKLDIYGYASWGMIQRVVQRYKLINKKHAFLKYFNQNLTEKFVLTMDVDGIIRINYRNKGF